MNVLFTLLGTMFSVYLATMINQTGGNTLLNSIAWFLPAIMFCYTIICGISLFEDDEYN
tara:strand:+ start:999 stop:1175 length:177 start_codon:yes stop_codon:yes gene_type:complete